MSLYQPGTMADTIETTSGLFRNFQQNNFMASCVKRVKIRSSITGCIFWSLLALLFKSKDTQYKGFNSDIFSQLLSETIPLSHWQYQNTVYRSSQLEGTISKKRITLRYPFLLSTSLSAIFAFLFQLIFVFCFLGHPPLFWLW